MPDGSASLAGGGGNGSITQLVTASDGQTTKSYANIFGAEIMRPGTWNGNKFTSKDLEDIASAAPEVGYVPPLKVGHDESIGARAWGWVRNIRLAGEKLVADLMDIPESLAAVIRERGYDQLSAEVYLNLDRDGKRFRRALKAVALLGAEVPAVSDLKPLRELFADASTEYRLQYSDSMPQWDQVLHGYPAKALCFTTNQSDGGRTMPDKTPDDHLKPDPEVAKLREEAAALKAKADAQAAQLAEQKAAAEAQAAELVTLKTQSQAQAAELKDQRELTLALEAKNREIALTAKLDAWKGPPAFRPFLEALYRTFRGIPPNAQVHFRAWKKRGPIARRRSGQDGRNAPEQVLVDVQATVCRFDDGCIRRPRSRG